LAFPGVAAAPTTIPHRPDTWSEVKGSGFYVHCPPSLRPGPGAGLPVLLPVLSRAWLPELVSALLSLGKLHDAMKAAMTPPLYDYLALPCHERPAFALRTREGKVVRLPDRIILESMLVAPLIDPADPRAVYQRIAHDLRTQILNGDLPPGSMLPSETELVRSYGSSRGPVRQAINLLRSEGLIDSHQGRGVFVRQRPPARRLQIEGMDGARETEASSSGEVGGQLEVRRYAPVVATAEVAHRLGLQEGTRVLARGFRFIVEGRPAQLADSYIPYDLVKGTPVEDPDNEPWPGGTIAQLRSLGVEVREITEDVATRTPTPDEIQALELRPGTPVFEVTRTIHAADRPVTTSRLVIAGDRYVLSYRIPIG
jgi:GntR family transcriptional regulator